jgi:hypothetical protein
MTIGDVLAAVSAAVLVIFSWIAMLVMASVVMPARVTAARERIEASPGRCGLLGAGVLIAALILTAVTMHALVGAARLVPFLLWGLILAAAVVGSAGIVQIVAMRTVDAGAPRVTQLFRAAALYALAGLFPICGWMIVTPIALVVSLGAAISAPKAKTQSADSNTQTPELASAQAR